MTLKSSIITRFNSPCSATLNSNLRQTVSALFLAGCLLASSSAFPNEQISKWDPTATVSMQLALQKWPSPAEQPRLTPDLLGNLKLPSLAEEASKQAQVKYLSKKWEQSPKIVRSYVDLAWAEAEKREGLEPELLIAIMQKESSLRPKVQSRYGAQGLMQVVRRWHREKLRPAESLFDPAVNIRVGAHILEEYLELANGNLRTALTKYSGNARNYANAILKETEKLARVVDQANTEVAMSQD